MIENRIRLGYVLSVAGMGISVGLDSWTVFGVSYGFLILLTIYAFYKFNIQTKE